MFLSLSGLKLIGLFPQPLWLSPYPKPWSWYQHELIGLGVFPFTVLELIGLGMFPHNSGADWPWSPSHNTGADLAWSDPSPYTGADMHRALECSLSHHCHGADHLSGLERSLSLHWSWHPQEWIGLGVFSFITLPWSWSGLERSLSLHWSWYPQEWIGLGVFSFITLPWLGVIPLPTLELIDLGVFSLTTVELIGLGVFPIKDKSGASPIKSTGAVILQVNYY